MGNLKGLTDAAEVVHYVNANIPIYVSRGHMSYFNEMKALGHWHEDIEIMKALQGHFSYMVNGRAFQVNEGEAIIVNSRQMHYGYSVDGTDCEYLCVLFRPELLAGNAEIKEKYIDVIVQHPYLTETYLQADAVALQMRIDAFLALEGEAYLGCELEFLSNMYHFWLEWYRFLQPELLLKTQPSDANLTTQKQMIAYIYQHYADKITLADIAQSGGVCRSKCCEIFRNYLGKTPIAFVNDYRLQVGMNLLSDATRTVTEIAFACGFNSPSYFSELFLRTKGCTPRSYREEQWRKEK